MEEFAVQIGFAIAVLGFMWKIHREVADLHKGMADLRREFGQDNADLRDRMSKMEGMLEILIGRPQESQSRHDGAAPRRDRGVCGKFVLPKPGGA